MAAASVNECSLKDVSHPTCIDQLKTYNTATFKLVKTGKAYLFSVVSRVSFVNIYDRGRVEILDL